MEVQESLAASYPADGLAKAKELCSVVYFSLVVSFLQDPLAFGWNFFLLPEDGITCLVSKITCSWNLPTLPYPEGM